MVHTVSDNETHYAQTTAESSPMRLLPTFAVASAAALVLAGCSGAGASSDDSGLVRVVASTNVYGDIAASIGGDLVDVTSIISNQSQDPHSYEATARDHLALSKAQLVIENGGGYDPFIGTLLDGSDNPEVVRVSATEVSGRDAADDAATDDADDAATDDPATDDTQGDDTATDDPATAETGDTDTGGHDHTEGVNEHVWYSLDTMGHVAEEIARELAHIDPENAAAYDSNYEAFAAQLDTLEARADAIAVTAAGRGAAITEPVPLYLLLEVGLDNRTPEAFSSAIEEGSDVAPAVLRETLDLVESDTVALLAYNQQTAGAETEQVRAAAEAAGVPVVSFAETMPEDDHYIGWMSTNLDAIETALG